MLNDPLLKYGRGEQITCFDAFFFEFRKGHRPSILMPALADNFTQLQHDVL